MLTYAIIQPSPFCNIDCKYCYLPNRSSTKRMTQATFARALEFLNEHPGLIGPRSSMIWHCGEPLAAGLGFYRQAYEEIRQQSAGAGFLKTCFSTNATLISQEWCDLFRQIPNLRIRVSIDGPEELHDLSRVRRDGSGTFAQVMHGIQLLRQNDVPFDVLCVLRSTSLEKVEELWHFFNSLEPRSIGFCVEEILGENIVSSFTHLEAQRKVQTFFKRFMDLRDQHNPGMSIREIDELLPLIRRKHWEKPFLRDDNLPLKLISIAWDGTVNLFSPELMDLKHLRRDDFILGNVHTHSIADILASPRFQKLHSEISQGVAACKDTCAYFRFCGGGFPVSKLLENGSFISAETLTCKLRVKAICDAVLQQIQSHRIKRQILVSTAETITRQANNPTVGM